MSCRRLSRDKSHEKSTRQDTAVHVSLSISTISNNCRQITLLALNRSEKPRAIKPTGPNGLVPLTSVRISIDSIRQGANQARSRARRSLMPDGVTDEPSPKLQRV